MPTLLLPIAAKSITGAPVPGTNEPHLIRVYPPAAPRVSFTTNPISANVQGGRVAVVRAPWKNVGGPAEEVPIPEVVAPLDKLEGMLGGRLVNIYVELDGRIIAKAIGQPLVDEIRLKTGVHI